MYQARPTITNNLNQQQLLQLMLLADRFAVRKVLSAAAAALVAVPADQFDWDTALQLLQLPWSCVLQPDFKAAHQLAVRRMIQKLGDLETVWASDALQQQLLALPFDVLQQLLQHEDTRVATENTVVFTIERWQRAQVAKQCRSPNDEQVQQLVHLVRMHHCTPYYAGTVMPHSSVVQQGIEHWALPLMRECCTPGSFDMLKLAQCAVLHQYPAWSAAARPKSEQQPVLMWQLPLTTLQSAVEQLFSSGRSARVGLSAVSVVQGQPMQIKALVTDTCNKAGTTDTPALHLGLYLRLLDLPTGAVRIVRAKFSMLARGGDSQHISKWTKTAMSSEKDDWGFTRLLCLGPHRSWQAVKAELKRQGLVHCGASAGDHDATQGHAQGCYLHIEVHVNELD
jgi:hypothetical protein